MKKNKGGNHTAVQTQTNGGAVDPARSLTARIKRRREVQLAYYYRNRKLTPRYEERMAQAELFNLTGKKKCKICGEPKELDEFYPSKIGAYRCTDDCKECRKSISLENYYFRKERSLEKTPRKRKKEVQ